MQTNIPPQPEQIPNYASDYFQQPNREQGMAVASLVLGLISCVTLGLAGIGTIAAFILGVVALRRARSRPSQYGGEGFAIAGIITSVLSLVVIVVFLYSVFVTLPRAFASGQLLMNETLAMQRLSVIGMQEKAYHDYYGKGAYATTDQLREAGLISHQDFENGYRFKVLINADGFEAFATPEKHAETGYRSFFVSMDGLVRGADHKGQDAKFSDPVMLHALPPGRKVRKVE
jgi:Domain of unknown function (DUF4190)